MDVRSNSLDAPNNAVQSSTGAANKPVKIKQLIIRMERTDVSKIISLKLQSDTLTSNETKVETGSPKNENIDMAPNKSKDPPSKSKDCADSINDEERATEDAVLHSTASTSKNDEQKGNIGLSIISYDFNDGVTNKTDGNVKDMDKSKVSKDSCLIDRVSVSNSSNKTIEDLQKINEQVEACNKLDESEKKLLSRNSEDIQKNKKIASPVQESQKHESLEKQLKKGDTSKENKEKDTENVDSAEDNRKSDIEPNCKDDSVSEKHENTDKIKSKSDSKDKSDIQLILLKTHKTYEKTLESETNEEVKQDSEPRTPVVDQVDENCKKSVSEEVANSSDIIEIEDDDEPPKKLESSKEDDEDVPGDFFDDFLKEDFMAGLDIVDEDDEELEDKGKNDDKKSHSAPNSKNAQALKLRKKRKIDHVLKFRQSPPGLKSKPKRRKPSAHEEEMRKLDAELDSIRKTKPKKPEKPKSTIDADEFDIRRDPEKTKRDIQRDKVKCAKDREQKIINEKLSIVETGLVPPGMEMEVDIEEVRRQERIVKKIPPMDLRNRIRSLRSKTPERKKRVSRTPEKIVKSTITAKSPEKSKHEKVKSKARMSPRLTPPLKPSSKKRRSKSPTKRDSSTGMRTSKTDERKRSSQRSPIGERDSKPSSRRSPRKSPTVRRTISPRRSPKFTFIRRTSPPRRRSPKRSPRRSPKMSPRRSPKMSPRRSPTFKSSKSRRSRSRSRRSRSRSPLYRRERISSPIWRERRRDRSYSPIDRRNRSRSRSMERPLRREEKRSFLEELAEKLNAPRAMVQQMPQQPPASFNIPFQLPQMLPVHTAPVPQPPPPQHIPMQMQPTPQLMSLPSPVPAPVPPPFFQQQHPGPPQPDQYDQSFFIGEELHLQPQPPPQQQHDIGQINHNNYIRNQVAAVNSQLEQKKAVPQPQQSPKDVSMLFQDKKIRLSEFLAITAKPEVQSSAPDKLHEKIKVIQRCQETINHLMSPNKKLGGRLVVRQTGSMKRDKKGEDINQSPLLRSSAVRLPFTTPLNPTSNQSQFSRFCQTLLDTIGVERKPKPTPDIIVLDDDPVPIEKPVKISKVFTPPKPVVVSPSLPIQKVFKPPPQPARVVPEKIVIQSTHCSSQTDPKLSACKECERRKAIRYENESVQCGVPSITYSVSTQCTEADFYSMIPKTQSLANLTPAQLLGRSIAQDSQPKSYEGFGIRMYPREEPPAPSPLMFPQTFNSNPLRAPFMPSLRGNPPSSNRYSGYNNRY